MKKLISSTISFITSAALLMCAGFGAMAAENTEEYIDPAFSETELLLGDLDTSLKLPEYPAVESNYKSGSFNYKDQLDANNLAVYNALAELNEPSVSPITIKLPETVSIKLSALPNSSRFTEEDDETYQLAIFGNCKPGIDAVMLDKPELYWIEPSGINIALGNDTTSSSNFWTGTYTVKVRSLVITPAYLKGFESLDEAKEYGEKLAAGIELVPVSGDTRYATLKNIHDYIAKFTYYDTGARFSSSALGALAEPGVVCEGYSEAFKLICDKLDIPCICVFGNLNAENNTGHMWNYVKMEDDKWYAMDVTWDDTDGTDGREVKYDYFLKGSKSFFTNHTPESDFNITILTYPEISEDNYVLTTPVSTTTTSTTTTTTTTTTPSTTTTTTTTTTTSTSTTTTSTTTTSTTTTSTSTSTTSLTTTTTTTTAPPTPLRGDLNNDGEVNVADLVFYHLYLHGKVKISRSCDLNDDGTEDVFDLVELRNILIKLKPDQT
ncbi:MAG: hypothetical protein IKH96_10445 [Ruminococcus sp.]|uniref:transglutaminase domain-containing protein n=1 Tax=Ruminococcus sp. TaxID=41978 RepID=UPI0025D8E773|nr:transglutaminase domain-containing protein [Ruminococcus sp.]MBR6996419.1 hypothetical protein [Ruminococcus sp.]